MPRSLAEYLLVMLAASVAFVSQVVMKQGMKAGGAISLTSVDALIGLIRQVLTSPVLLFGYGLSAVAGLLWLVVLSRLDLSFAAPMLTAVYYGLLLLSSTLILREVITPGRWAGAVLIVAGVMLISRQ